MSHGTEAQTETRKRSNANLKPFKLGAEWRGNRGGRPKGLITTALCKQLLRKAAKGGKSELQAIVEAIVATAKKGTLKRSAQFAIRSMGRQNRSRKTTVQKF